MKTQNKPKALKEQVKTVEFQALSDEEVEQVTGGVMVTLETNSDGVHVISSHTTGKVLEVTGVVKPVTAKPIAYDANQTLPQKWSLSDIDENSTPLP